MLSVLFICSLSLPVWLVNPIIWNKLFLQSCNLEIFNWLIPILDIYVLKSAIQRVQIFSNMNSPWQIGKGKASRWGHNIYAPHGYWENVDSLCSAKNEKRLVNVRFYKMQLSVLTGKNFQTLHYQIPKFQIFLFYFLGLYEKEIGNFCAMFTLGAEGCKPN